MNIEDSGKRLWTITTDTVSTNRRLTSAWKKRRRKMRQPALRLQTTIRRLFDNVNRLQRKSITTIDDDIQEENRDNYRTLLYDDDYDTNGRDKGDLHYSMSGIYFWCYLARKWRYGPLPPQHHYQPLQVYHEDDCVEWHLDDGWWNDSVHCGSRSGAAVYARVSSL